MLLRENLITYMNLLSILKIDNIFRLKTAVFTYKLINKINNVPIIFINTISTASSQHSHSTRFAKNQNFKRSKARTNYGISLLFDLHRQKYGKQFLIT